MKFLILIIALTPLFADPVKVEGGLISGQAGDVRVYRGVPFAAPPVGVLRWRPPEPALPWTGVRAATEFAPACYQTNKASAYGTPPFPRIDEDCLYLNVWTAAPARGGEKRPVMVWIHGGGHTDGSGMQRTFDGEQLARQGVVLVTLNYRLGPFGYLSHPALSKESAHGASGNYGTMDQIAALRWVKRNIAAFGGDPNRVTIFGESAGAVSTGTLMVSPEAKGLFHRAIMQSGIPGNVDRHFRDDWPKREGWEKVGVRIAQTLQCQTADCLRSKTAAEVLAAANPVGNLMPGNKFLPVVDGWLIPERPLETIASGKYPKVPVLLGSNADEGTILMAGVLPAVKSVETYRRYLESASPGFGEEVFALYPAKQDGEVRAALAKMRGHSTFVAPVRRVARQISAGGAPVYLYHFSRVRPGKLGNRYGAYHGAEIPYVFGSFGLNLPSGQPKPEVASVDRAVSEMMTSAWANFAAAGNPNGPGVPEWPAYLAATDVSLEIGDRIQVRHNLLQQACDLFDRIAGAGSRSPQP